MSDQPRRVEVQANRKGKHRMTKRASLRRRVNTSMLFLALCVICSCARVEAQTPEPKCPVVIGHVELFYNHEGGQSRPQLKVGFGNSAGKSISTITFSLATLDSGGYPRPYPDSLRYDGGLETAQKKVFVWDLAAESVDIHRTGETVVVQKVEFADATGWTDDGSESCTFKVDFHGK
jgi:hypothetical protein